MNRLMSLLKEKNHYLEKFANINELELMNFSEGDFENLEYFYQTREQILELINSIDGLIGEEEARVLGRIQIPDEARLVITTLLNEKDQWVKQILAQDLLVLSHIDREKSQIINELRSVKKVKKVIHAYHSGNQSRQLDEEA